jgi:hypothetical protein
VRADVFIRVFSEGLSSMIALKVKYKLKLVLNLKGNSARDAV